MVDTKIVFVGHDFKFIDCFIDLLSVGRTDGWPKLVKYDGHYIPEKSTKMGFYSECNVIFCEWALGNAVHFSNNKPVNARLIIRLHAQEIRALKARFLDNINWSNVDSLIVVSPFIRDTILQAYPTLTNKVVYIPNYVGPNKVCGMEKPALAHYSLGLLGIVPTLKRVDLAFELLSMLRLTDNRYKLFIKGNLPEDYAWMKSRKGQQLWYENTFKRYSELIESGHVVFEKASDDVAKWYGNIGLILSTSDSEGSHQAIAEGMFSGCVPVIRSWDGASSIYGYPVFDNLNDMKNYIISISESPNFTSLSFNQRVQAKASFDFELVSSLLLKLIERT